MPTPKVIDLSHHNVVPGDFAELKANGILGIIHKATEGLNFTDPKLKARHWLTHQAGLAWGMYHFLNTTDPQGQAAYFLAQTTNYCDGQTLLVVDYEDSAASLGDLKIFMSTVRSMTGRMPVLYTGNTLKEKLKGKTDIWFSGLNLWLADYGEAYALPPGFGSFYMRQYTDKGVFPGITGNVDLNEIAMPDETFLKIWTGFLKNEVVPSGSQDSTITVTVPRGTKVKIVEE